jgi:hypothetical protein
MKRMRVFTFLLVAVLAVYAGRAVAQHSHDHSADSTSQDQTKPGTAGPGMMGQAGMMGQNMSGMMHGMMGNQQQMFALMEKLMTSLRAIQNEKDPVALKLKLAEH